MSYLAGNVRTKTAAVFASAFFAESCLIGLASHFLGLAGAILTEGMIVGSPFCWVKGPVKYLLTLNQGFLYPLALAPYPLVGWSIGYCWPLRDLSLARLLRSALLRFAMVWVVIVAIGLWRVFTF